MSLQDRKGLRPAAIWQINKISHYKSLAVNLLSEVSVQRLIYPLIYADTSFLMLHTLGQCGWPFKAERHQWNTLSLSFGKCGGVIRKYLWNGLYFDQVHLQTHLLSLPKITEGFASLTVKVVSKTSLSQERHSSELQSICWELSWQAALITTRCSKRGICSELASCNDASQASYELYLSVLGFKGNCIAFPCDWKI